jgi:agmatinase
MHKLPVMLGGEHTITLGALRALRPEAVVVFDAHLDLRDELSRRAATQRTCVGFLRAGIQTLVIAPVPERRGDRNINEKASQS